jgi:hypothetical protein
LPSKKKGPSKGMRLAIFLLLVILVLSSVLVVFNFLIPQNQLAQPSPSSFASKEWMQYIPANVEAFRFMNMSVLAPINGLFTANVMLDLTPLGMNITIYDVRYGVDIQISNESIMNILVLNQSYADSVYAAFTNSSYVRQTYHNNTLFAVPPNATSGEEGYWISVNRGALVTCSGGDQAFAAIKSVIDADAGTFFSNDTLKIAYLLTSKQKDNFMFTYYTAGGGNTYNVDWLMGSATNSSQLDVRISYHFMTPEDLSRSYGNFTKTFFASANTVYTSVNYIIGDYAYAYNNIKNVVMGL